MDGVGWCDPREAAGHTPAWRLTLGTALGVAAMVNIGRAQPIRGHPVDVDD